MSHKTYTTVKHPRTGEVYAAEFDVLTGEDETGEIEAVMSRAAGPIHLALDAEELAAYLDNQDEQDCRDDAVWLRREIEREMMRR